MRWVLVVVLWGCQGSPGPLGLRELDGKKVFQACDKNCLSSFSGADPIKAIDPSAEEQMDRLLKNHFGAKFMVREGPYARYELPHLAGTSDLEFLFEGQKIHFRVRARGWAPSALKTIEGIRFRYYQRDF